MFREPASLPSSESTLSLTNKCDTDSDTQVLHSSTSSSSLSKTSGDSDVQKSKESKRDDDRRGSPTPSQISDTNYQVIVALGKGNSSLIEKNTGNLTDEKKQRRRAFAMLWFANEDWEG